MTVFALESLIKWFHGPEITYMLNWVKEIMALNFEWTLKKDTTQVWFKNDWSLKLLKLFNANNLTCWHDRHPLMSQITKINLITFGNGQMSENWWTYVNRLGKKIKTNLIQIMDRTSKNTFDKEQS